jgi:hypothetical protein
MSLRTMQNCVLEHNNVIKGTVPRDFLSWGFFRNHPTRRAPDFPVSAILVLLLLKKIGKIFATQGAPPVFLTPAVYGKTVLTKGFPFLAWHNWMAIYTYR